MNKVKNTQLESILAEQANFCRAREIAESANLPGCQSETLLSLIAKKLGKLANAYDSNGECEGIKTWKDSGIYFNSSVATDIDERDFTFTYNATLLFVDILHRSLGDSIFDKRYNGYYRNTSRALKTEYASMLDAFLETTQSISDNEIFNACVDALHTMKEDAVSFQLQNNEKSFPGAVERTSKEYDEIITVMQQKAA